MKKTFLFLCLGIILFSGCKKKEEDDDNNPVITPTSTPSPMGNVGTTFTTTGISGVSNINMVITDNANNISTIQGTAKIDNPAILAAVNLPIFHESWYTVDASGNASGSIKGHL